MPFTLNFTGQTVTRTGGATFAVLNPSNRHLPVHSELRQNAPIAGVIPQTRNQTIAVTGVDNGTDIVATLPSDTLDIGTVLIGGNPPESVGFDPETSQLTIVAPEGTPPNSPITVQVERRLYATNRVSPTLFTMFWGLPIRAQVNWSLTPENHPSGSFSIIVAESALDEVLERFRGGTEFSFAGIGWYIVTVTNRVIDANPREGKGVYSVEVSLSGRWQRQRYNRPSPYFPGGAATIRSGASDPECQINGGAGTSGTFGGRFVSVQTLAQRRGVNLVVFNPPILFGADAIANAGSNAFILRSGDGRTGRTGRVGTGSTPPWGVEIPQGATRTSGTSWEQEVRSRLRMNGCFIDFNSPSAVQCRDIYAVRNWEYKLPQLTWVNKGDCEFGEGNFGYAFQYAAAVLNGKFNEPNEQDGGEETQNAPNAPPRWVRRRPVRLSIPSGDVAPATPPANLTVAKTMSLNWDASGPTKERVLVDTEDGMEVRRQRWTYGLMYTSDQVLDGDDQIRVVAAAFWGVVQYENTEPVIDERTGYILGSRTTGWVMRRFRQESDEELEVTQKYSDPADENYRALYRFRQIPIYSVEKRLLRQYAEFYEDAAREIPPYEVTKICQPDGSSSLIFTEDPNYVRPMFPIAERSYRVSFMATPNPDSTADEPLPPIIMGEELDTQSNIQILPSTSTTGAIDLDAEDLNGDENNIELYKQFNADFSSQGQSFDEVAIRKTFSTSQGRPGPAQRRNNQFERLEPELPEQTVDQRQNANDPKQYEYIVCSPGHTPDQVSEGSISATHAQTLGQAIRHAQTEMKVQDIMTSVEFTGKIPFNVAIRPFDRMHVTVRCREYRLRVTNINQSALIIGREDGTPMITSNETSFSAGIDREIPLSVTRRLVPTTRANPRPRRNPTATVFFVVQNGLEIGDLDVPKLTTRRNYAAAD